MSSPKYHRALGYAAAGFFMIVAWLIIMTFDDYGVSWDEYFRWQGGERKYDYYEALFSGDTERAAELRSGSDHYPGFFDLSLAVARRILPFGIVGTGHLGVAVFGFAGLLGVYLMGRNIRGPAVGLIAAMLLAIAPKYWGHMFINPKDMPFAALFCLALWALIRVVGRPDKLDWRTALVFGFTAGACLSVRIGGLLIFCYAGLFLGLQALYQWRQKGYGIPVLMAETLRLIRWIAIAAIPAFLILLAFWPNAHRNPFGATADTLSTVTSFGWEGMALFRGELLGAGEIPRDYLPTMLVMGLPDMWFFIVLALLLALVWTKGRVLAPTRYGREHAVVAALIFAAVFPVAYIIYKHAVVYDGLRHVLFILPILAVLLAMAIDWLWRELSKRSAMLGYAWVALCVAFAMVTVWENIRLHPYQYTYYNRMSGGIETVQDEFDVEYWGTAYRDAMDIVLADVQQQGMQPPIRVAMLPPKGKIFERFEAVAQPPIAMVALFLPQGFELVDPDANPDYYLGIRRFGFADMLPGVTVGVVERDGVVFARVTRMDDNE
ncbi:ArnT family glycosyltransferase [Cerasicoccus fimbriatus]|uniref:ArnT family glycosyltransferase n=1 Tax=Cerasicoccus fimbriatus TaxID=3014554 RepID=UPI0022B2F3ED|nr:glycosyltransferase family 39 protein [Cerasicoccus sp. TK19100]